jgi:dTDP-L-rhamnose 4-epimerase
MSKRVLITGGAGFIGSDVADELTRRGHCVRVLDNLTSQVHGREATRLDYLHPDVELVIGDMLDPEALSRALRDIEAVYHFDAAVGVGQSMYEVVRYAEVNTLGTALRS